MKRRSKSRFSNVFSVLEPSSVFIFSPLIAFGPAIVNCVLAAKITKTENCDSIDGLSEESLGGRALAIILILFFNLDFQNFWSFRSNMPYYNRLNFNLKMISLQALGVGNIAGNIYEAT